MYSQGIQNSQRHQTVRQVDSGQSSRGVEKSSRYLVVLLIVGAIMSMITNLTRADYNLPIYAYLFIVTMYMHSQ